MADLNRDQYVGLILDALSGLESGGNYEAKSPQNAYGKYQFIPGTWATWSKRLTESIGEKPKVLKQTPQNQEAVAWFKVNSLIDDGYDPKQIASIWYSGRPDYEKMKGVTDAHGRLDVPAYVSQVCRRWTMQRSCLRNSRSNRHHNLNSLASSLKVPPCQDRCQNGPLSKIPECGLSSRPAWSTILRHGSRYWPRPGGCLQRVISSRTVRPTTSKMGRHIPRSAMPHSRKPRNF